MFDQKTLSPVLHPLISFNETTLLYPCIYIVFFLPGGVWIRRLAFISNSFFWALPFLAYVVLPSVTILNITIE
jgi:hypothetical protein